MNGLTARVLIAAIALAWPGGYPGAKAADPAAAAAAQPDVFRQLAEAKSPDAVWERSFAAMIDRAKIEFLADPKLAQAERQCPGMVDAAFLSARPVMHAQHFADRDRLREGMARLLAKALNEAQAREALAFYRSDEGLFLLELGADSNNYEEKFAAALAGRDRDFDRAAFDRDLERTHDAIHANADPGLISRAEDRLARSGWFQPYMAIHRDIQDLRFAITKASRGNSAQAAEIDSAVKRGLVQHFVNCGKAVPLRVP